MINEFIYIKFHETTIFKKDIFLDGIYLITNLRLELNNALSDLRTSLSDK